MQSQTFWRNKHQEVLFIVNCGDGQMKNFRMIEMYEEKTYVRLNTSDEKRLCMHVSYIVCTLISTPA